MEKIWGEIVIKIVDQNFHLANGMYDRKYVNIFLYSSLFGMFNLSLENRDFLSYIVLVIMCYFNLNRISFSI